MLVSSPSTIVTSNPLDPRPLAGVACENGRPSGRSVCKAGRVFLAGDRSALLWPLPDRVFYPTVGLSRELYPTRLVDFKTATDILTGRITAEEIAEAAGVSISSIARARLDPASSAYRSPPEGWQEVLARLADERGGELKELADMLRRGM